jgi:sporulation protein YlmC with PRC-barrel domain
MISREDIRRWGGKDVFDPSGEKIGSIEDFYLDKQTYDPDWVIVKRGFLGSSSKLIPYMAIDWRDDHVVACYDKEMVEDSPGPGMDGRLSDEEEYDLMEHYGLMRSERTGRLVGTMGHSTESAAGPRFAGEFDAERTQAMQAQDRDRFQDRSELEERGQFEDRRMMEEQAAAAHPFSANLEDEDQERFQAAPPRPAASHPEESGRPAGVDETSREAIAAAHPFSAGLEDEEEQTSSEEPFGEQVSGSSRLVRVKKYMVTERVEHVPLSEEEFEEGDERDKRAA